MSKFLHVGTVQRNRTCMCWPKFQHGKLCYRTVYKMTRWNLCGCCQTDNFSIIGVLSPCLKICLPHTPSASWQFYSSAGTWEFGTPSFYPKSVVSARSLTRLRPPGTNSLVSSITLPHFFHVFPKNLVFHKPFLQTHCPDICTHTHVPWWCVCVRARTCVGWCSVGWCACIWAFVYLSSKYMYTCVK